MNKKYLLIHGAYHGAWCWEKVKKYLEGFGDTVYAIDLPGHGSDKTDRNKVGIEQYVASVCNFVIDNDLTDLVIVGHSFAGVVITKVIEKIPERITKAVFISAIILDDGEMFFDFLPETIKEKYIKQANENNSGSVLPNYDSLKERFFNDINDIEEFSKIFEKLTPQPLMPYQEKVYLKNIKEVNTPMIYIFLKNDMSLPRESFEKMSLKLPNTIKTLELESDHEIMFSHPNLLADTLNNI